MGVDRHAAEGFGRAAAAYERGRPGYPQAAIDWMVAQLIDRVLSISFIATLRDDERSTVADQVSALVKQAPIRLPYLTDVLLFRRR